MWNLRKGILFLFLSVILFNISSAQNYWLRQISPVNKQLSKCIFVDSLYGWAAGDSCTIIHTSNNGINWSVQNTDSLAFPICDVFFLNRTSGWALCNDFSTLGTIIFKTTNSGQLWTNSRFPDTNVFIQSIFFTDSLNGYLGALNGKMFKTTNGGLNWTSSSVDSVSCSGLPVLKIRFLNSQTGYACGGAFDINGQVWKTTNSGVHWSLFCLASEPLYDILFRNNNVFACGGDFEFGNLIASNTIEGNTWRLQNAGCFGIGQYLAFRTPAEVWMPLGFSGYWAVSIDSALSGSWQCIPAPDTSKVFACQFTSPTNGWAFGSGGSIFKYNTSVIGISGNGNNVPLKVELFQNYPNPFNPVTSIKFNIVKTARTKLSIFDLLGREVRIISDGIKTPGEYSVEFDGSDLPSGVYFYILESGDSKISKKMVLLK